VPLVDDDALVLDTHPFRDRHLIVAMLTHAHGTLRGVLRGARSGRVPQTAATQVLSLVRVSAFLSPHAELATFRQVSLLRSSFPLAASVERAAAAAVVAELLAAFCPPEEPAERFFRLGAALLEALLSGVDPQSAVAYVQFWVLGLGGVLPPLDRCAACGALLTAAPRLRPLDGQPLCAACATSDASDLGSEGLEWLISARRQPLLELDRGVPAVVARWLDGLVAREAERPLRALDFLRRHGQG
jgi:DNA repair protein RecO